ncbi:MAG TPA: FAD binding domain-containing protein [Anaerolineae bacterium]|jgi:CO/xanthine dehydrogenase FAD-binding subunit
MNPFGYVRAGSIDEAVSLLNTPGVSSRVLAGGTDLLVAARASETHFDRVVDISSIPEMRMIEMAGKSIRIGASATFSEVMRHPLILRYAPFLAEAAHSVRTMQITNTATLGGNVANAAAAADTPPVLVCLDAAAIIATPGKQQRVPVADLLRGHLKNNLPAGGLIVAFEFVPLASGMRTTFLKLGRRNALTISRINMAAAGRTDAAGRITEARLVVGACFARPRRAHEVEALLQAQAPSTELYVAAGQLMARLMVQETGLRWSTEYKAKALAAMVEEALESVLPIPQADARSADRLMLEQER